MIGYCRPCAAKVIYAVRIPPPSGEKNDSHSTGEILELRATHTRGTRYILDADGETCHRTRLPGKRGHKPHSCHRHPGNPLAEPLRR